MGSGIHFSINASFAVKTLQKKIFYSESTYTYKLLRMLRDLFNFKIYI